MSRAKSANTTDKAAKAESRKAWWQRYKDSLRYALYVITHPFDGFWDLIHEKRGSIAAANTFMVLFLLTYVLRILYTNFQFMKVELQYLDILEQMGSLLIPFLILCLANWAMTTLFEGKGRFKDIYMAMCYALVPYILIQLPLVLISNMLTLEEGSLYGVLYSVSLVWCVLLVFVGLMQVHDYGPAKTFIFIIVTIFGATVIVFLILVFFSLLSDAVGYFVSIYREIVYRMN